MNEGFNHRLERKNHLVQYNKQYHMKVLLNRVHLKGDTLGFIHRCQNYSHLTAKIVLMSLKKSKHKLT